RIAGWPSSGDLKRSIERQTDIPGIARTLPRILSQADAEGLHDMRRNNWEQGTEIGVALEDHRQRERHVLGLERADTCEHLQDDAAECPDGGTLVYCLPARLR